MLRLGRYCSQPALLQIGQKLPILRNPQPEIFSNLAWHSIQPVFHQIIHHNFNKELAMGTLPLDKFKIYYSQDALYLDVYAKALRTLSNFLVNPKDKRMVEHFADSSLNEKHPLAIPMKPMFATIQYMEFLERVMRFPTHPALLAATVLPCFWIYYEVACELLRISILNHVILPKYHKEWIESYSSPRYRHSVVSMIDLVNRLADQNRFYTNQMIELFKKASQLELKFWDSAYKHSQIEFN